MSREQKANALGVPPDRIPVDQPVAESPASQSAYAAYVDEHNRPVQTGFCIDNEAYKARGMKDEMSTVKRAVMPPAMKARKSLRWPPCSSIVTARGATNSI